MSGYKADDLLISVAGSSYGQETSFSFTENVTDPETSTDAQAELADWNYIKDTEDTELLNGFLQKFPEGTFAALASARLKNIKRIPNVLPLESSGTGISKTVTRLNGKIAFTTNEKRNNEIYLINADGTGRINITNSSGVDAGPVWSPDGTRIAFNTSRDQPDQGLYDIYVMRADGSKQTRLTNNAAQDFAFGWSPDATKIAFFTDRDGNFEIYVMNADGTGQTRLTNNPAYEAYPGYSPDGRKLVFTSARDGNQEIYVMNADGSEQTRLTNSPGNDNCPFWSPDGQKIAFVSYRDGNIPEIYVMNSDGSGQTRLTNDSTFDDEPRWSPDGRRIVFQSNRLGNCEIFIMNSDGTEPVRVTHMFGKDQATSPSWQTIPVALEIAFTPSIVPGGQPANLTATLSTIAPAGGVEIELIGNDDKLKLPPTLFVPAGARSVMVPIATRIIGAAGTATVQARLGAAFVLATLNILPVFPP
jgi:TolB protein